MAKMIRIYEGKDTARFPEPGQKHIVKVQRDSHGETFLVYSEDETTVFFMMEAKLVADNVRHIPPLGKEYWEIEGRLVDGEKRTYFLRKVENQNW